jgi:CheY-like chemotaxis protein
MPEGRLLILEDDLGVAKIVDLIARSIGLEGRFVTNAQEFISLTNEWKPTHIALDLMIPDADGEEVLAEMARRGCSANIIITSGMGERMLDAAKRTAIQLGLNIVGVLAKPFSSDALRELLIDPNGQGCHHPLGRRGDFEA